MTMQENRDAAGQALDGRYAKNSSASWRKYSLVTIVRRPLFKPIELILSEPLCGMRNLSRRSRLGVSCKKQ